MIALHLVAPFAACRPMTAGWYRSTAPTLTPSAAYGLLLNVACIETRLREEHADHSGNVPSTMTRPIADLPTLRLAMGIPEGVPRPEVQSIYQQLHNYPVGRDAGVDPEWTKGSKNNISPVRREFLSRLHLVMCLDADEPFEERLQRGIAGAFNSERYGLPFVGENAFLVDRLTIVDDPPPCRWYEQLDESKHEDRVSQSARLTVWIDRADMSRTRSALFAPTEKSVVTPPARAWTTLPPASA